MYSTQNNNFRIQPFSNFKMWKKHNLRINTNLGSGQDQSEEERGHVLSNTLNVLRRESQEPLACQKDIMTSHNAGELSKTWTSTSMNDGSTLNSRLDNLLDRIEKTKNILVDFGTQDRQATRPPKLVHKGTSTSTKLSFKRKYREEKKKTQRFMKLLDVLQEKFIKYKRDSKLKENVQKRGICMLRDVVVDQQKTIEELTSKLPHGMVKTIPMASISDTCTDKENNPLPQNILKRSYTFKFHKRHRYVP